MEQARTTRTLLAVIVTVVVFAALKVTQPITLPLAFGAVLLLFFRPLQRRLERRVPHWVSVVVMLIVLALSGLGSFASALRWRVPFQRTVRLQAVQNGRRTGALA